MGKCLFVCHPFSFFDLIGSYYWLVTWWPMLMWWPKVMYRKVIMFIYLLNTFVFCCTINLNFLFRHFCSGCWYLSVWIWIFSSIFCWHHFTTHVCTKFWCQFCRHHFTAQSVQKNFGCQFCRFRNFSQHQHKQMILFGSINPYFSKFEFLLMVSENFVGINFCTPLP